MTILLTLNFFIVICDPPCVQGACVANDTCNCVMGYIGERCTEAGKSSYALNTVHTGYACKYV